MRNGRASTWTKILQIFSSITLYSFISFFISLSLFFIFQSVSNNSLNSLFIFLFPILLYPLRSSGGWDNLIGIVTALWTGWMRIRNLAFLLFSVYFILCVSLSFSLHLLQWCQYCLFIYSLLSVTSCVQYLNYDISFLFSFSLSFSLSFCLGFHL